MKLVLATPLYPPEIGGPATYAKLLEEGLPGRDIEIETVKFGEVRHLPKFVRHIAYARRVYMALRDADMALALDPVSVGLPTCIAAWLAKKPFVVKIVGDYAWEQGRQRFGITANLDDFVKMKKVPLAVWLLRRVQTGVARHAARVIVPSRYLKVIIEGWGVPSGKIVIVYNAVKIDETGDVPEAVARLPRPLVVTAGRLIPWKHVDGVIDAVEETNASLAVIGDGPLRSALEARALDLGQRVAFTGVLAHKDLLAVVGSADVFVLNSSYEGLSHLLIEALLLGVPIVATRVGGNPEIVVSGETGALVSVGDTPALTEAIQQVIGDAGWRAHLVSHVDEVHKRFSVDMLLTTTAHVLTSLI